MIRKLLHSIIWRRHYWRNVGFSELAELYASRLLRIMALNLIAGFTGIYMYQLGYPVWQIALVFGGYFLVKAFAAFPAAYFVARVGPKHAMLVSNVLYIPALAALTQLSGTGWPVLIVWAILQPLAVTIYDVAFHTSFSKVKHRDHAGKELGFMYIAERIGAGLSPLMGGFIAFLWGPEATMWMACVLFVISAGPLFLSPELITARQPITFHGFNWRAAWRGIVSAFGLGVDQASSIATWSLFVALAVFGTTSNVVYAQIGGLMTLAVIASLVFSHLYGLIIDRHQGGELLKASVAGNALLHLLRLFVSTPIGVVMVNISNEAVTSGYSMPYLKGQYDMADDLPGYRIVYMSLVQFAIGLGSAVFCFLVALLVHLSDDIRGLQLAYIGAAVLVLLVLVHGFPALRSARLGTS